MASIAGYADLAGRGIFSSVLVAMTVSAASAAAFASEPAQRPVVQTSDGWVRGLEGQGVREFRGIPFAAPPLGDLRFEPPAPVTPWPGEIDASRYRSACPQVVRFGLTEASDDEDCLHLNVAVPIAAANKPRPVLVWFYGGAFVGGSTQLYPLDYLAREGDLIVVSANYRLGPLGFMPHPAFGADFNGGYALEDQRQALRWVQQNIAAFGGDPRNVTIGGVSAGAASVCMHLFTPERTAGLFQKAIVQSAGCTWQMRPVSEAQKTGLEIAKIVGCTDPATALACLRSKSAHDLVAAGTVVAASDYVAFAPSVGTKALPRQGSDALRSGQFVHVPILNGGSSYEMRVYVGYEVEAGARITPEIYRERLRALYGSNADQVLAAYPVERYSSAPTALGTVMSDYLPGGGLTNCLFLRTAALASHWVPVYEYEFADPDAPPVMNDPGIEIGPTHTSEMPYQFPHFSNTSHLDGPELPPPQQRLSQQMVAYWSAFVHSGNPGRAGGTAWQPYAKSRQALRLRPGEVAMFDAGKAHQCALWARLYPDQLAR